VSVWASQCFYHFSIEQVDYFALLDFIHVLDEVFPIPTGRILHFINKGQLVAGGSFAIFP
jgi:hypothetical protein